MRRPVITPCGHTFDHDAIGQWVDSGHSNCPTCRAPCRRQLLVPNFVARGLVALRAPSGTVGPVDDALAARTKSGRLRVSVRFKDVTVRLIIRPSTTIARLRRACRSYFGVGVRFAFAGSTVALETEAYRTAGSIGLTEGSVLTATEFVPAGGRHGDAFVV